MLTLDQAAEKFEEICAEYELSGSTKEREAEVRMRLIDRILFECLGWSRDAILELPTSQGDASDYLLRDGDKINWVIVEAKRPSVLLANPQGAGKDGTQGFKIAGPALTFNKNDGAGPIFHRQVSKYVEHGTSLAVITNGNQWVAAALPSRSGKPLGEDKAIVFASLATIESQFERFYNFFSLRGVRNRYLEKELLEEKTWVTVQCRRPHFIVAPGEVQPLQPGEQSDEFYRALGRALDLAFSPVEDDPLVLEKCFVETRFSEEADDRLARLTEHLAAQLVSQVEGYETAVRERTEEIESKPRTKGNLALLTGQKSSGKSTYVRRFFDFKLSRSERSKIYFAHVRFDREPDLHESADIHRVIAESLEQTLLSGQTIRQNQFFDLYHQEWSTHKSLFGDQGSSKKDFILEQRRKQKDQPLDYAVRLLDHSVRSHGRLPCLVLDGWDHLGLELQAKILEAATLLFQKCFAVVTVVADDTTMWKLRNNGLDQQFHDYLTDRFWLPRPKIGEVLDNRLEYLQEVFTNQAWKHSQAETRIGKSGMRWAFDPTKVSEFLRDDVLFGQNDVRTWIGELANHDMRRVLKLVKELILSPALRKEPIFKDFVSGKTDSLGRGKILSTIIRPNLDYFREDSSHGVFNIFDRGFEQVFCPLAPALILATLEAKEIADREAGQAVQGFIEAHKLVDEVEAGLRIPRQHVDSILRWLHSAEMIETYDPSASSAFGHNERIKILPRGALHLRWALNEWGYMREMVSTHPFLEDKSFEKVSIAFKVFSTRQTKDEYTTSVSTAAPIFVEYLLKYVPLTDASNREFTKPAVEFCDSLRDSWDNCS